MDQFNTSDQLWNELIELREYHELSELDFAAELMSHAVSLFAHCNATPEHLEGTFNILRQHFKDWNNGLYREKT